MTDATSTAGEFYSRYAGVYDRIANHTPLADALRRRSIDALEPDRGDVVVEMGVGTGANLPYLREAVGPEGVVVGVDVSRGVLERAHDRITSKRYRNVHVVRGDATRPPFAAATDRGVFGLRGEIDAVFASFVSGMVARPADVVDDWCDLVGAGGRIACCDLARSTSPLGSLLNPAFAVAVDLGSPPGIRTRHGAPVVRLDERVRDAHRQIHERCEDATTDRTVAGFARITAGTVDR